MNKKIQEKLLNIVKNNYEETAAEFDKSRQGLVWPELSKLAEALMPDFRVLDIGCGNGRLLNVLKDKVKKENYLGIDLSENLIALAKKNYPAYDFMAADILDLDKMDIGQFDFIFSIAMLHHLPGRDLQIKSLKILSEKLEFGGTMVISVQNFWHRKKYLKLLLKYFWRKIFGREKVDFGDIIFPGFKNKSERYYHAFTFCGLKKISQAANLKIIKLYKDKFNYYLILRKH